MAKTNCLKYLIDRQASYIEERDKIDGFGNETVGTTKYKNVDSFAFAQKNTLRLSLVIRILLIEIGKKHYTRKTLTTNYTGFCLNNPIFCQFLQGF